MLPINTATVSLKSMADYVQHIVSEQPHTVPTILIQVECEKSGTTYWENTSTGERAWSKEMLLKEGIVQ